MEIKKIRREVFTFRRFFDIMKKREDDIFPCGGA